MSEGEPKDLSVVLQEMMQAIGTLYENQSFLAQVLEDVDVAVAALTEVTVERLAIPTVELDAVRAKVRALKNKMAKEQQAREQARMAQQTPVEAQDGIPEGAFIFGGNGS